MEPLKAFDYMPHDLLKAKTKTYGFSESSKILCSYLECWNHSADFHNEHSMFQITLVNGTYRFIAL